MINSKCKKISFVLIEKLPDMLKLNTPKISDESKHRINAMTMTNDGFKISEIDLKLRGPGDILGTRQSGDLDLKIADLVKDSKIFDNALSDVKELLKEDHLLLKNTNQNIKNYIINNTLNKSWNLIG